MIFGTPPPPVGGEDRRGQWGTPTMALHSVSVSVNESTGNQPSPPLLQDEMYRQVMQVHQGTVETYYT